LVAFYFIGFFAIPVIDAYDHRWVKGANGKPQFFYGFKRCDRKGRYIFRLILACLGSWITILICVILNNS
jgi:hypothetical protein